MNQRFKEIVEKLTLQHLYALLVGAIIALVGCWLSFRFSYQRGFGIGYHQRSYGIAIVLIAGLFSWLVVKDSERNNKDR